MTLNDTTKEIEIASPLPAGPRLRSFVALLGCNEGSEIFSTQICVHVHEAIKDMWITPSLLHVRKGAEKMRFSVLARFDDGVIGDITNWSRFQDLPGGGGTFVHRQGEALPALHWRSDPGTHVTVDPETGVLTCDAVDADETIIVERRPLPAAVDHQAKARALGAPEWSAVKLTHVQGKGFSGMAELRNVLFLPEGFVDTLADRRQFGEFVRGIVRRLTYHPQASPFDLLSQQKSLNYFMAWVPSPEAGLTILNELDRLNVVGTRADAQPMDTPVPARLGAGVASWNLQELLWEVGWPTPVHDPQGSPLGTETSGRLEQWRELYGEHITSALVSGVYQDWLDVGDRVLLDELDTAFHIAMSDRPRLDGSVTEREPKFNRLRMSDADFNSFLSALTDDKDTAVGGVWASGGPDEDLVVMLCHTLRAGGANAHRQPSGKCLSVVLGDDYYHHVEEEIAGPGFDVVVDSAPDDILVATWLRVAHELAHSWTLDDEYGGGGLIDSDSADKLKNFSNVQPRKTLLTGGSLDADKIKWRWPRIAKAGVLAAVTTDDSGSRRPLSRPDE